MSGALTRDAGIVPRCLGAVCGPSRGPTVVITGGLHGNEPAGINAARSVLAELGPLERGLSGSVIAFSGNRTALARGVRFVSRDLNRGWRGSELERLRASREELSFEDAEQRELYEAFIRLEHESTRLVFLDLHTTSGPTEPFVCFSDTPDNRALACVLPVNVVLGLERTVDATMLSWASSRGHLGLSFEGGQHLDEAAPERHATAVWLFLVALGVIDAARVPERRGGRASLERLSRGHSRVVEIVHRHVVQPGDDFEMLEGFEGFGQVEAGQIVARDRSGPVCAPESGLMVMPRYQGQGEDGFFLAREVACPLAGDAPVVR